MTNKLTHCLVINIREWALRINDRQNQTMCDWLGLGTDLKEKRKMQPYYHRKRETMLYGFGFRSAQHLTCGGGECQHCNSSFLHCITTWRGGKFLHCWRQVFNHFSDSLNDANYLPNMPWPVLSFRSFLIQETKCTGNMNNNLCRMC